MSATAGIDGKKRRTRLASGAFAHADDPFIDVVLRHSPRRMSARTCFDGDRCGLWRARTNCSRPPGNKECPPAGRSRNIACICQNRLPLLLAVENVGERQQNGRRARWALARAIADAVTVRAKVRGRKRDMLHMGEFHIFTLKVLALYKSVGKRDPKAPLLSNWMPLSGSQLFRSGPRQPPRPASMRVPAR